MIARIAIELPSQARVIDFERDLGELARRYGTNLERSPDPRMPAYYVMCQRAPEVLPESPTRSATGAAHA